MFGLRDRVVVESGEVPVNGRMAAHTVMEGRMKTSDARVRIESYVVKGEHCVWDLLYTAEPASFDASRGDFQALVESFVTD
jgi:formyltetrahydrofolate hydrolase